jgi:hypothetical protein
MRQDDHEPLVEKLIQNLDQARLERVIKQIIKDELNNHREWFLVTYEGYDVTNGLYKVKKSDGSIIYAQAKSMPSSVSLGSNLVAFVSSGRFARLFVPL